MASSVEENHIHKGRDELQYSEGNHDSDVKDYPIRQGKEEGHDGDDSKTDTDIDEMDALSSRHTRQTPMSLEDDGHKNLIKKIVFQNTTFELYICDARSLLRHVDNWSFNRCVRHHHVKSIVDDLKCMRYPHLLGSIKIVRNSHHKQQLRIIDGQHRLLAIRQIMEQDEFMTWNMDVIVEIYEVENINYGNDVFDLYIKANKNMNVEPEDSLDMEIVNIVNALCQDKILSMGIIDKQDGSVYRPRISKKELYENFKSHYKPLEKMRLEHVVARVKEINRKIGLMSHRNMFGEKSTQRVARQKKKADDLKFYLNVADSRYPPKIWIPIIYQNRHILESTIP